VMASICSQKCVLAVITDSSSSCARIVCPRHRG
jgi:hypothetical protein